MHFDSTMEKAMSFITALQKVPLPLLLLFVLMNFVGGAVMV